MTMLRTSLVLCGLLLVSACGSAAAPASPQRVKGPTSVFGRPTPLSFGIHVSPAPGENPISPPERFEGYHVGLDLEVSSEELDQDVEVFAVCDGEVTFGGFAEGYGGLVTQACTLNDEAVIVLYGHLRVEGLPEKGTVLERGEQFAVLGAARSTDTDGNRKHLHLGIHRGTEADMRGYVQTEEEIAAFLNPKEVLNSSPLRRGWFMKPYWKSQAGSGTAL